MTSNPADLSGPGPARPPAVRPPPGPFPWAADPLAPWFTRHAMERLREHRPDADAREALAILSLSRAIEGGEVAGLLCRSMEAASDLYFLAPGNRGIFVVVASRPEEGRSRPYAVVTYVRLSVGQVARAGEIWGVAA